MYIEIEQNSNYHLHERYSCSYRSTDIINISCITYSFFETQAKTKTSNKKWFTPMKIIAWRERMNQVQYNVKAYWYCKGIEE